MAACTLAGISRATHYRRVNPAGAKTDPTPHAEREKPPSTLSEDERGNVLAVINSPTYADLSICQIWARELDEDRYHCSMSTMYRIARVAGQTRERRRLATHPAKVIPELLATGPSQVWSWDITKLRGPVKGVWYHLYALIDIYSRTLRATLSAPRRTPLAPGTSSMTRSVATVSPRTPSMPTEAPR